MLSMRQYDIADLRENKVKDEVSVHFEKVRILRGFADARKKAGLTQTELAERAGMKQSDISALETGKASPSLVTLLRVAKGLNMKLNVQLVPNTVRIEEIDQLWDKYTASESNQAIRR